MGSRDWKEVNGKHLFDCTEAEIIQGSIMGLQGEIGFLKAKLKDDPEDHDTFHTLAAAREYLQKMKADLKEAEAAAKANVSPCE